MIEFIAEILVAVLRDLLLNSVGASIRWLLTGRRQAYLDIFADPNDSTNIFVAVVAFGIVGLLAVLSMRIF